MNRIKDFMIRCIAYTIDIKLFEFTVQSIFIVCFSSFENDEYKIRYKWFLNKFKTFSHSLNDTIDNVLKVSVVEDLNNENCIDNEDCDEIEKRAVTVYINSIKSKALKIIEEKEKNTTNLIKNSFKALDINDNCLSKAKTYRSNYDSASWDNFNTIASFYLKFSLMVL